MEIRGPIDAETHAERGLLAEGPGTLELPETTVYPGWVNAHDHLDFNLFPGLRTRRYGDWHEWGVDVHTVFDEVVQEVLAVPWETRVALSELKCLLQGITTVVHHGPERLADTPELTIWKDFRYLHSTQGWRWKRHTWRWWPRVPLMVHVNEGTTARVRGELAQLRRWNVRRVPLLGIHGVSLTPRQARRLQALIWCPGSNEFLYGQGPSREVLAAGQPVLLGSDSTISGPWSWYDHLRAALAQGPWEAPELLRRVLHTPAQVLAGLEDSGTLASGDWVVLSGTAPEPGTHYAQAHAADVLLVSKAGRVVLFDERVRPQLPPNCTAGRVAVASGGAIKWVPERFAQVLRAVEPLRERVGHLPGLEK